MKRRTFIRCVSGGALWASALPLQALILPPLRLGVITDLRCAEREMNINRYCESFRRNHHRRLCRLREQSIM